MSYYTFIYKHEYSINAYIQSLVSNSICVFSNLFFIVDKKYAIIVNLIIAWASVLWEGPEIFF